MARLEDLERRVRILEEERELLINNPHTIWTVIEVLELDLNREARKKAGLLTYLIYKHVHNCDPVKVVLPGIGDPSRYSERDLWIIRAAVRRIHDGPDSQPPPMDLLSNEDWIRFCVEAHV